MDLGNHSKVAKVANLVYNINLTKLSLFTRPEAITYIGWLKSNITGLKSISINMKFDTPDLVSEAIRKGLNWEVHLTKLIATSLKARSCSVLTASLTTTLKSDVSPPSHSQSALHRDIKSCTADYHCCAAYHGVNLSRSNNYKARIREKERMKKAIREAPIYWPLKAAPQDSLETPNIDSQTTNHVGPIPPNPPAWLFFFLRGNPRKAKRKPTKCITH